MTRTGALPERVDLLRRAPSSTDARGNAVLTVVTELLNRPARVDISRESETIEDRDRAEELATVVVPATWAGARNDLDAHDAIRYPAGTGNLYELIGPALEARDHAGRLDHYELHALRIVG